MKSCIVGDSRLVTPVLRQLHTDNVVVTEISGLLLREEATYLVDSTRAQLRPSTVARTSAPATIDVNRSSRTAFVDRSDPVVDCLEDRMATIAGLARTHMEPMQVTDYTNKQEYKPHYDYFDRAGESDRTTTLFAYLQEYKCGEECGGATVFPRLQQASGKPLRVYPTVGNAVMWSNRTHTGGVNPHTLHSGEALRCADSHKVGLNVWFRDEKWK